MNAIATTRASRTPLHRLARLTFAAGMLGMGLSFVFLASNQQLDVIAGAAGFVAGSVLAAAGLVSLAVVSRASAVARGAAAEEAEPTVNVSHWLAHFARNRENRAEPNWHAPIALAPAVVQPLVHSLEQFQLGDGGGPADLIAWNRERLFRAGGNGMRRLVELWFAEESEHSRLLGAAVARFGGRCIQSHWSFTAFCMSRRWFGVRFELTVLLLTEIASTAYYRLLWRHGNDTALRAMCRLILRDEGGHVAFHRERLANAGRAGRARYGQLWAAIFRTLGLAAATMLWVNHAAGLRAIGAGRAEFYGEVWQELSRFVRRLRLDLEEPS
jgi:hypothetical protein